jgi:hypothetical protein
MTISQRHKCTECQQDLEMRKAPQRDNVAKQGQAKPNLDRNLQVSNGDRDVTEIVLSSLEQHAVAAWICAAEELELTAIDHINSNAPNRSTVHDKNSSEHHKLMELFRSEC